MNQFYVSLIFLGIILIIFSLIWVVLDKKNVFSFIKSFDVKKQELVEIINDAEQMIEELNKFSDYIVTQMDVKNEELQANLKQAELEIKILSQKAQAVGLIEVEAAGLEKVTAAEFNSAIAVNGRSTDTMSIPYEPLFKYNSDFVIENMDFDNNNAKAASGARTAAKKSEKVIQINNKFTEVLKLSENGLDNLDIAKKLNMGKGEIELILGINK
jgi:hypothetical protein